MRKILNRLFILLASILFLSSCSETRIVSGNNSFDYFFYSIGQGQSVYFLNKSISENKDVSDYLDSLREEPKLFMSLKTIIMDDEREYDKNILKVESDFIQILTITCLKPFEKPMKIKKIIYDCNGVQTELGCNIELKFNRDYNNSPKFPRNLTEPFELGVNRPTSDLALNWKEKCFYIYFNNAMLGIEKWTEFIINDISFNNPLLKIVDINYADVPYNFYFPHHRYDLEYKKLTEPLYLNRLQLGAVLKINFDIAEGKIFGVGCDLDFNVRFNGDDYCVPYNVYYCTKLY